MPHVFLSFRKLDSRWMRDRVYQALADRFGAGEVFKSGESIPPGADFARILDRQAAECELMLVLIGPAWLDLRDGHGKRLLDRDDDWVRREIATAMGAGNRVVPLLLGDGTMLPEAAALPREIADLGRLQFIRVPETHLDDELGSLCDAVATLLPSLGHGEVPPTAAAEPAAQPPVSMTAHVSGGGSVYQAARDQTITLTQE
ncbi:toll/interleukin-1 receptor domain-containing protein [Streptomyces sp. CBMA123]|uniref:toll/interleukin-1 receptor domain-containing protein n=1 Tax=Streptomyces sp. CBMA123 TaxID=1896313 RepID=UPI001661B82C|nr:toll/interleukin-1 receptor domain-containing protein [Streptomyces sp. CBMA123]